MKLKLLRNHLSEMSKCVINLSANEVKKFFLKSDSYTTLDLPEYFSFGDVLQNITKELGPSTLTDNDIKNAKNSDKVNCIIFANKDGNYAWRKFELINPLIYVSLVNIITEPSNWKLIVKRIFQLSSNKSIKCLSYPTTAKKNKSQKASQISEWVNKVERESIRLSLNFEYICQTDVSNCYGSIYTHSLAWSIHGKRFSKAHRGPHDCVGNLIDNHIQAMTNGQTNGIPQGSLLMDFLAEIVLSYADKLLTKKLNKQIKQSEYQILRYRDDYRIFVKTKENADLIIKSLSEVLSSLGFQLNNAKTSTSDELILTSIKPDKLEAMRNPIGTSLSKTKLRNDLISVYQSGVKFPNSGSIRTMLTNLYKLYENNDNFFKNQEEELISILTNIGRQNPNSFPIVAAFISKLIKDFTPSKKTILLKMISKKIGFLPNFGLLEVWVQRMSIPNNVKLKFKESICKKIDDNVVKLFNIDWSSNNNIKNIINTAPFFDSNKLTSIDKVITVKEIELFKDYYDGSR